jgi:hypothetical protein
MQKKHTEMSNVHTNLGTYQIERLLSWAPGVLKRLSTFLAVALQTR